MPSPFQPGDTLIFIGDHTSPDDPGYINVIAGVAERFHPQLRLHMISAGARGQTAGGLGSRAMVDILGSSRPQWLVIGLGLADALREPVVAELLGKARSTTGDESHAVSDQELEAMFGPEHRAKGIEMQPHSDVGPEPEPPLTGVEQFTQNLGSAIASLGEAGVRSILLTTICYGADHPLNPVLKAYNRAIRQLAEEQGLPIVDVERAFRNINDRATNYKQTANLYTAEGMLNSQGQTLVARTFLDAMGLLPNA